MTERADNRADGADSPRDAGDAGTWIDAMRAVVRAGRDAEVPCDGCVACCTSSQFVHVAPDETDALAHIPAELLFPAPGRPAGHKVMGYDEHGRCPMLRDGACSIYEHRPATCRAYDCRVFAAAGTEPDDPAQHAIAERVRRWRFRATAEGRARLDAVRAAASFLANHDELLADRSIAAHPLPIAVLAVDVSEVFRHAAPGTPPVDEVRVALAPRARPAG